MGKTIEDYRVNKSLIKFTGDMNKLPSGVSIKNLEWVIIEVTEEMWLGSNLHKKHADNAESTDIVFRIVRQDGTYYYAFMLYISNFGIWCDYTQRYGEGKEEYIDVSTAYSGFMDDESTRMIHEIKVMPAICGLASPDMISAEYMFYCINEVKRYGFDALEHILSLDSPDLLEVLFRYGAIHDDEIEVVRKMAADISKKTGANECNKAFDTISHVKRAEYFPDPVKEIKKNDIPVPAKQEYMGKPGIVLNGKRRSPLRVKLDDGGVYSYYGKPKMDEGCLVVIGKYYMCGDNKTAAPSSTTGRSGIIVKKNHVESIRKGTAVDIEFAFCDEYHDHVSLTDCAKFLSLTYKKRMEGECVAGSYGNYLYPITFLIEKNLAALTLLQFQSVDEKRLKKARDVINGSYEFPVEDILEMGRNATVSVKDVRSGFLDEFVEDKLKEIKEYYNGHLLIDSVALKSQKMVDFLNEYIPLATVRTIFSCDLVYMLEAYVKNCSRIKNDVDRLIKLAEEAKAERCLKALKEFKQSGAMVIEEVRDIENEVSVEEIIEAAKKRKLK